MEANKTWTVIIDTPSGLERVIVVRYPRRPTEDITAGLVRLELGMSPAPDGHRYENDASVKALEAAGYRLIAIDQAT